MLFHKRSFAAALLALSTCAPLFAADGKLPTFTDAEKAGDDFKLQGEYSGEIETSDGKVKIGLQVIAQGDGKFKSVGYPGGLPGDGWTRGQPIIPLESALKDGVLIVKSDKGSGEIKDGVVTVKNADGKKVGEFKKTERKSSTLGKAPPAGAVVIFDGKNVDGLEGGKMTPDGLLIAGAKSKQSFGNFSLHLEFRTPYMPTAMGQARGNSGVYLVNRYEIQVLDSFGLEGANNECGGIYSLQEPKVNMCLPPLSWQTYDIDFTAPVFDGAGKKTKNARATVKHNDVLIYDNFEIPNLTPGGDAKEGPLGPLMLQDHGNPVHYRNVWVVEKK